ncbi:hypothetical protein [Aliiruegeria lutimaris]|uniref:Tripartite ATP-independent transporter, DctM component n=1 Tax=Aliiruegeria lutimaris TaxID=571298 RepID=A0A1G8UM18_9RHOB|nr:hypothetical protein [Aliiruegeria lutimaris]SDJ54205.1 hypothetical protein SAMN04488026_101941 [Aliiruegeria lutimaris]
MILVIILGIFIILGCFMDSLAMILVVMPFFGVEILRIGLLLVLPGLSLFLPHLLSGN